MTEVEERRNAFSRFCMELDGWLMSFEYSDEEVEALLPKLEALHAAIDALR